MGRDLFDIALMKKFGGGSGGSGGSGGGGGNVLIVDMTVPGDIVGDYEEHEITLSKTGDEIYSAYASGAIVYLNYMGSGIPVYECYEPYSFSAAGFYTDGNGNLNPLWINGWEGDDGKWYAYVNRTTLNQLPENISWNDLADKPFNIVELMPETQFMYNPDSGMFVTQTDFEFVAGKTYIVNWNGVEYTAAAKVYFYNGGVVVGIGNEAFVGGENNGLPFVVANELFSEYAKGFMSAVPLDGSATISVGIKGVESSALYDNSSTLIIDARGEYGINNQKLRFEPSAIYVTPDQIYAALASGKNVSMLAPVYAEDDGMVSIVGIEHIPLWRAGTVQGYHTAQWSKLAVLGEDDYFLPTVYNNDGTYVPVGG